MKIILNKREEILEGDHLTIEELLERKNLTFKMRVIKRNGKLIKKDQYASTIIREGDEVQVLYLMSGG